jgi:hypothetical protein
MLGLVLGTATAFLPHTASAAGATAPQTVTRMQTIDLSAAKRKRIRVYPAPYEVAPPPPVWGRTVPDPTAGPYSGYARAKRWEPNRCIEDLGYGNYRYCGW